MMASNFEETDKDTENVKRKMEKGSGMVEWSPHWFATQEVNSSNPVTSILL